MPSCPSLSHCRPRACRCSELDVTFPGHENAHPGLTAPLRQLQLIDELLIDAGESCAGIQHKFIWAVAIDFDGHDNRGIVRRSQLERYFTWRSRNRGPEIF